MQKYWQNQLSIDFSHINYFNYIANLSHLDMQLQVN